MLTTERRPSDVNFSVGKATSHMMAQQHGDKKRQNDVGTTSKQRHPHMMAQQNEAPSTLIQRKKWLHTKHSS